MVQETATTVDHPLMRPVYPRFTPQEAVILSEIVSAAPGYIAHDDLIRKVRRAIKPNGWGGPSRNAIMISVCNIRAKIGERKNRPSRLITVYEIRPDGRRGEHRGYAWKG